MNILDDFYQMMYFLLPASKQMLYGETPCNPNMAILDLEEFGKLGRSLDNVLTIVDSTFASPYLQPVIKHGIDISMHSWYVLVLY